MRKPRVVVTIHGIRTHGLWQKKITPHLAKHGLVPYHIDYDWFSALSFFLFWKRESRLEAIQNELRELVAQVGATRVSIIAHSFGTWLAMEALMRDNGSFKYDRVVLTGSIVPCDFDWATAFKNKWVIAVRNERATSDWVVALAAFASRRLRWISRLRAGDSGRKPFAPPYPQILDDYIVGHHSATHNPLKFERWARFIAYPYLTDELASKIRTEMAALRQEAGSILGVDPSLIRANLFAPIDGALRIVPGAVDNMNYVPEYSLAIEPGHGATGTAFATGEPCVVVKQSKDWTGSHLPGDELNKINPALRWVVSMPIRSETRSVVVGVVNLDGLETLPGILGSAATCPEAVMALYLGMLKRFQPYLEAAFRGDELDLI